MYRRRTSNRNAFSQRNSGGNGGRNGARDAGDAPKVGTEPGIKPRTVSEASRLIQGALKREPQLQDIHVIGEVSNLFASRAGHTYFKLVDQETQLQCVLFRYGRGQHYLEDGAQVVCDGAVGVYQQRGELQLVAKTVTPAGVGDLQAQLEELKRQLRREGLFDDSRKRVLPRWPTRIAVVTSEEGAVWHDIQNVIRRRYPLIELMLVPSAVQGDYAPVSIVEALTLLHQFYDDNHVDAVIVGRGGGSAEDLMAYNDERVARAIFASRIPVISAVGHETDFTIADDVADVRAPTPSAAAELATPSIAELSADLDDKTAGMRIRFADRLQQLRQRHDMTHDRLAVNVPDVPRRRADLDSATAWVHQGWSRDYAAKREAMKRVEVARLANALSGNARMTRQRWENLDARLRSAAPDAARWRERIDDARLPRAFATRMALLRQRVDAVDERLVRTVPETDARRESLAATAERMQRATTYHLAHLRDALQPHEAALRALGPGQILARGYAMVRRGADGELVTRKAQVGVGDIMELTFADGSVETQVGRLDVAEPDWLPPDGGDSRGGVGGNDDEQV